MSGGQDDATPHHDGQPTRRLRPSEGDHLSDSRGKSRRATSPIRVRTVMDPMDPSGGLSVEGAATSRCVLVAHPVTAQRDEPETSPLVLHHFFLHHWGQKRTEDERGQATTHCQGVNEFAQVWISGVADA
jgi:hypothetical protein